MKNLRNFLVRGRFHTNTPENIAYRNSLIEPDYVRVIGTSLQAVLGKVKMPSPYTYLEWDFDTFFKELSNVYEHKDANCVGIDNPLEERLRAINPGVLSNNDIAPFDIYKQQVFKVFENLGLRVEDAYPQAVSILLKGLIDPRHFSDKMGVPRGNGIYYRDMKVLESLHKLRSVNDYLEQLDLAKVKYNSAYRRTMGFGPPAAAHDVQGRQSSGESSNHREYLERNKHRRDDGKKEYGHHAAKKARVEETGNYPKVCWGCGGRHHGREQCWLVKHPDFNTKGDWWSCEKVKRALGKGAKPEDLHLTRDKYLDGKYLPKQVQEQLEAARDNAKKGAAAKANRGNGDENVVLAVHDGNVCTQYETVQCRIALYEGGETLTVCVLFDTGALKGNYCSEGVAQWLRDQVGKSAGKGVGCRLSPTEEKQVTVVELATGGASCETLGKVGFSLIIKNELLGCEESLGCLTCNILPTNFDLIIGLPTIRTHALTDKLRSFFRGETSLSTKPVPALENGSPVTTLLESDVACMGCTPTQCFGPCKTCTAQGRYKPIGERVHELNPYARSQVHSLMALRDKCAGRTSRA
jgi:hypothetical protein